MFLCCAFYLLLILLETQQSPTNIISNLFSDVSQYFLEGQM